MEFWQRWQNGLEIKPKRLFGRVLGGDPKASDQDRLDQAVKEAETAMSRYSGQRVGAVVLKPLLGVIKLRHRLTRLDVVPDGDVWVIDGEVNPRKRKATDVKTEEGAGIGDFKTKVNYYAENANRGANRMIANPLGPDIEEGTRPSEAGAPPIWAHVNTRRKSDKRLYVLGHLLNQHLGGLGNTPRNLTPITFSMNKRHESQVEKTIKDNIGIKKKPRWFYYDVQAIYPASRRTIDPSDRSKGVVEEEGLLVSRFKCNYYEMGEDPKDPKKLVKKDGGLSDTPSIEHDIPPYPDT